MVDIHFGDCVEVLQQLEPDSIDSIVTDPPYHLESVVKRFGKEGSAPAKGYTDSAYGRISDNFIGKEWDSGNIAFDPDTWAAMLRVLKPGGYLLAFSHARNYHRMATAIEKAGFDIRDQIMWLYGSGHPKARKLPNGQRIALKPSHEPIAVARKPFKGTVLDNIEKHGTAALNVEACRVGERYPANTIHDGIDEEWAKFFYCSKTSQEDRGPGNDHPTVKPNDLMRYLCRLVTPAGGTILDPFLGSGSTGKAAVQEGYQFTGIEKDAEYYVTACERILTTSSTSD